MNTKNPALKSMMKAFGIYNKSFTKKSTEKLTESQQKARNIMFDNFAQAKSKAFIAKKMRSGFKNNSVKYK